MNDFKIGDVVYVGVGSPDMVVEAVVGGEVKVCWFTHSDNSGWMGPFRATFNPLILKLKK